MAKNQKPTNAFGIDPNSFKAINKASSNEEALMETPVQEEKPAVVVQNTHKIVKKERKTEHIHLLLQKSLTEETDRFAERTGRSRAAVIELALRAYLGTENK